MGLIGTCGNKIDANLIPSNIKKDVSIFGVEGDFEGASDPNLGGTGGPGTLDYVEDVSGLRIYYHKIGDLYILSHSEIQSESFYFPLAIKDSVDDGTIERLEGLFGITIQSYIKSPNYCASALRFYNKTTGNRLAGSGGNQRLLTAFYGTI